jgi:hypothetical protein
MSKLRARPLAEWQLIGRTLGWLVLLRSLLWVRPFPVVQRRADAWAQPGTTDLRDDAAQAAQLIRFVPTVGRLIPGASCLTQALAARILLGRRGYVTELRLGVGRDAAGRFAAHAWLERDGRITIGAAPVAQFTPLPTFGANTGR